MLVPQGAMVLSTHPTAVGSQQLLQCPIQHCAMQMEALPKVNLQAVAPWPSPSLMNALPITNELYRNIASAAQLGLREWLVSCRL